MTPDIATRYFTYRHLLTLWVLNTLFYFVPSAEYVYVQAFAA